MHDDLGSFDAFDALEVFQLKSWRQERLPKKTRHSMKITTALKNG